MLVKNADIQFPAIRYFVGNTDRGENVEGEVLTLRAGNVWMAVDDAGAKAAGNIRNEPPIWSHEIVTHTDVKTEVMIFAPAKARFQRCAQLNLLVTTQPPLGVTVDDSPAHARRYKFRANLVA